jgi:peroxiredoxin (alkyl hydroperoxide reductase subunit C)
LDQLPRTEGGIGKIEIPPQAETSKYLSRDYGVLVENMLKPIYGAAVRELFIINGNSKVRSMRISDDAAGRYVDETLRLINGFNYSDKN